MRTVIAARLTAAQRRRRLTIAVIAAGVTGAAAAVMRPRITGPVHYEAVVALLIVLPLVCLALTFSLARVPWRGVLAWLFLELAAVCLSFVAGWWLVPGPFTHHLLEAMCVFCLVAVVSCATLLIGWQQLRPPRAGPYCPGCGYCLIGVPVDRCPECGRDFDLRELGVAREALRTSAAAG